MALNLLLSCGLLLGKCLKYGAVGAFQKYTIHRKWAHVSKQVWSISDSLGNQQVHLHSWDCPECTAGAQRCGTSSLDGVTLNWLGELSSCCNTTKGDHDVVMLDSWLPHALLVHTKHKHSAELPYCFA